MTHQTKKSSIAEVSVDTIIGFAVSYIILVIMLFFKKGPLEITAVITIASLTRKYLTRRWFNWRDSKVDYSQHSKRDEQ